MTQTDLPRPPPSCRSAPIEASDFAALAAAVAPLRRALAEAVALGVDGIDAIGADLDAVAPRIALIGQVKAGKTALANALAGRPGLLPVHVNPYTAVVTTLHLAPSRERDAMRFAFFDDAGWRALAEGGGRLGALARRSGADDEGGLIAEQIAAMRARARRKLGARFETLIGRHHDFDGAETRRIARYVAGDDCGGDAEAGRYAEITRSAELWLRAPEMPVALRLVDTPGVNDPFLAREQMTLGALGEADVAVLVLSAHQALSTVDLALLRLCAVLGGDRLVVFVNRVDELAEPARDCAEIEARLRATLRAHGLVADAPILFGSALGRQGEGLSGLGRSLAEIVARGPLAWHARRLAGEAGNAARRTLAAEAAARDAAPRLGRTEVAARLDAIVAETEAALQRAMSALWRRLSDEMTRTADAFGDTAARAFVHSPFRPSGRAPGRTSREIDTMPLRHALKAVYESALETARGEIEAALQAAATGLAAVHVDLFPDRRHVRPTPPPVPVPPPPVTLARTLTLDLDDIWWRRLLGLSRPLAWQQAEVRRLVEADAAALIEEVGAAHVEPMAREIAERTRDFLSAEAYALEALTAADAARRAPPSERRGTDDRHARLERLIADLDVVAGAPKAAQGEAA